MTIHYISSNHSSYSLAVWITVVFSPQTNNTSTSARLHGLSSTVSSTATAVTSAVTAQYVFAVMHVRNIRAVLFDREGKKKCDIHTHEYILFIVYILWQCRLCMLLGNIFLFCYTCVCSAAIWEERSLLCFFLCMLGATWITFCS
jgi:hypothetical protein